MADVYLLPVTNNLANYEFTTELEDESYNFYFRYNSRMGRWIMSISDITNNPIVQGLVVNVNVNFLESLRAYAPTLPLGTLLALNLEAENEECIQEDMGVKLVLTYEEIE